MGEPVYAPRATAAGQLGVGVGAGPTRGDGTTGDGGDQRDRSVISESRAGARGAAPRGEHDARGHAPPGAIAPISTAQRVDRRQVAGQDRQHQRRAQADPGERATTRRGAPAADRRRASRAKSCRLARSSGSATDRSGPPTAALRFGADGSARRPAPALRLRRLPARPGGGGARAALAAARRARGDAHRRGQVALLPAARR